MFLIARVDRIDDYLPQWQPLLLSQCPPHTCATEHLLRDIIRLYNVRSRNRTPGVLVFISRVNLSGFQDLCVIV